MREQNPIVRQSNKAFLQLEDTYAINPTIATPALHTNTRCVLPTSAKAANTKPNTETIRRQR